MAQYRVAHDLDRDSWINLTTDSDREVKYAWGPYETRYTFPNYQSARAALDSLPDEKRMYGESYKKRVKFMKHWDSSAEMEREMRYLDNKRLLRNWGY